jgi:phenylacetate-coenzyme A ligase PaaK-like adenylate-forming protein
MGPFSIQTVNFYSMDREQQRKASAQRLFRYVREFVEPYHPFLRRLYRDCGVKVDRLKSLDDIRRLPIIDKSHLQSDPLSFILRPTMGGAAPLRDGLETRPPRGMTIAKYAAQALANYPREYWQLVRESTLREKIRRRGLLEWQPIHTHVSTGSSGHPTPVTYTYYDLKHVVPQVASVLIRPRKGYPPAVVDFDFNERALNIFPGAPHLAFFVPMLAKTAIGLSVFETFGGAIIPTDRQLRLFVDGGFTSVLAVPSYMLHWLRRAATLRADGKLGALSTLRRIILGAEPLSDALREEIRQLAISVGAWPKVRILQSFGMTEMKWSFHECSEGSGMHLNPKFFYWELLHPDTREPVAPGEPGVLVFSHIGWRGTVLIRFWTGDLVKGGISWERCPLCGYTFPRIFSPICRAIKDFTKLKGARIDLSLLVQVVRDTPGVRQFQIALESESPKEQFSRDVLAIEVCAQPTQVYDDLKRQLTARLKDHLEVSPDKITFTEDEADLERRLFAKNHIKAEYIVERRADK